MGKQITIREFGYILQEGKQVSGKEQACLEPRDFDALCNFIEESKQKNDSADAYEFFTISKNRTLDYYIKVQNYVGLIELPSGTQIQILPKIDLSSGEEADEQKEIDIFTDMISTLRKASHKRFNTANLKSKKMNIFEVFIDMYVQETLELVKTGLKSGYIQREDNLRYYKGKLQIANHIKHNAGHKERFYMAYDEYLVDRPENRIVKATLLKLHAVTEVASTSATIRKLLMSFENVSNSTNFDADFARITKSRETKAYELLIEWSKVFLRNKSFTTFAGSSSTKSLLFPMEHLFEAYVAYHLRKAAADYHVSLQDKHHYLFDEPTGRFQLRPDIVMTNKSTNATIILDTKWKHLTNNPSYNYGISQSDMYQMFAYAQKYETPNIFLLYPLTSDLTNCGDIVYTSKNMTGEILANVHVFFVDLEHIEDSMMELVKKVSI